MNEGLGFIVDQGIVVAENNLDIVGPLFKFRGVLHSGYDPVRISARLLRRAPQLAGALPRSRGHRKGGTGWVGW